VFSKPPGQPTRSKVLFSKQQSPSFTKSEVFEIKPYALPREYRTILSGGLASEECQPIREKYG
jgi:hypothetical protein